MATKKRVSRVRITTGGGFAGMTLTSNIGQQLARLENMGNDREFLEDALLDAAKPIERDAAGRAPRGPTGKLRTTLTSVKRSDAHGFKPSRIASVIIAPTAAGFYGYFVERGTRNLHRVQPFLFPAFKANAGRAGQIFAGDVRHRLERIARSGIS